jgi:hypothetical protein
LGFDDKNAERNFFDMICSKSKITKATTLILVVVMMFTLCCACTQKADTLDYSQNGNWAYYAAGEGKEADLFLICPTVDMGKNENYNMSMDDEATKESFVGALNMERGIYEDSATMYAPYYRQMTFPVYSMTEDEMKPYLEMAYRDVAAAFEYYFEHCNNGRPIILAGFSQGSQLLLMLMKEYFDDPKYSEKLVAAYCIGWRVTEEDIAQYPHLKMAQGENDTGVIISFNSEAEGIEDTIMVPKGQKTLGINPLNWKTDSTLADKDLNKGACFTRYSGEIKKELPQLTGAYLDENRGTLIVTDITPSDYSNSLFPDGVYHLYDYQFFYRNLQENVATRLACFLAKTK